MDLNKLMQQAQQMQKNLGKIEDELKATEYTGTASSDMVTVKVNGSHEVLEVNISEDLMNPEDREMLQDLILIAVNDAIEKSAEDRESKMSSITNGMKLPGM